MSATLSPAELAAIRQSLDHAASFDDAPNCECVRTDVDFYDNRGCESCNSNSAWNIARRKADRQVEIYAFRNLSALLGHIAEQDMLTAQATRYAKELAVSIARDYPAVPGWKPLDDVFGLLMQIDNMNVGMREKRKITPEEINVRTKI